MTTESTTADLVTIGARSKARRLRVEKGVVLRFLDALGSPVEDEGVEVTVPPTFPTTLQLPAPGLNLIDPARILHGEQEYIYERPLRTGDELTCVAEVAQVTEKTTRLGKVTVVVIETTGRDDDENLVLTERMTLIVR
nr:MaoC family dehydratase N-terminal domain-containing protein [Rhodococcus sp. (in: high G+C Gram-positive bacteria)]